MTGNVVISEVCCYVRVCRTKQGGKTRALCAVSWYHRMYNVINEVSHKPKCRYNRV